MANEQTTSPGDSGPTPERIAQMAWGFAPAHALSSAVELRLFTHIAEGRTTFSDLRAATGASERGLAMLLNAMVGLGFLTRSGDGASATYGLAPDAAAFLVEGRPSFYGGFVQLAASQLSQSWSGLSDSVRTGKPASTVDKPEDGAALWDVLVEAIFPLSYASALALGAELRRIYPNGPRVLDVAAGSGVWSIGVLRENPNARAVAFDLPSTLKHTRRITERHAVADRCEYRPGDIRSDGLGEAEFDAAILGHICHSEGAEHSQALFAKVARALKPGGTIVIADMLPENDRSGPPFPLLFALNMLLHTSEGDTFTFAEYERWLREAGFRDARRLPVPAPSPLVLATR